MSNEPENRCLVVFDSPAINVLREVVDAKGPFSARKASEVQQPVKHCAVECWCAPRARQRLEQYAASFGLHFPPLPAVVTGPRGLDSSGVELAEGDWVVVLSRDGETAELFQLPAVTGVLRSLVELFVRSPVATEQDVAVPVAVS